MKEEKLKKLLDELADVTTEPVRPGLTGDIKHRIPQRISPHRGGLDTINIIIDLRINKLTAAAVIIITLVLCANFFSGRDSSGAGIFEAIRYSLAGDSAGRAEMLAGMSKLYESLVDQGKDVAWYGDSIDLKDSSAVLMQWKLADGKYGVIFVDGRQREVGAEELIKLLTRMLQNKTE